MTQALFNQVRIDLGDLYDVFSTMYDSETGSKIK